MKIYIITYIILLVSTTSISSCLKDNHSFLPMSKQLVENEKNNADNTIMKGVPGEVVQALLVAHEAFRTDNDIPKQKRIIQNYYISINKESTFYTIYFSAKSGQGESDSLGGQTKLGKSVKYIVDSRNLKLVSKQFMK